MHCYMFLYCIVCLLWHVLLLMIIPIIYSVSTSVCPVWFVLLLVPPSNGQLGWCTRAVWKVNCTPKIHYYYSHDRDTYYHRYMVIIIIKIFILTFNLEAIWKCQCCTKLPTFFKHSPIFQHLKLLGIQICILKWQKGDNVDNV